MTEVVYTRKETALAVRDAAANLFFRYRFSVEFELGVLPWGRRRVDIIANKISGKIIIVEVKSSLADFKADKKWQEYRPYCDQLYLATTPAVYAKISKDPNAVPKGVGVILLDASTGYAYIAKSGKSSPLSDTDRIVVLARLAWRKGSLSKRKTRARKRVFIESKQKPDLDSDSELTKLD